jgi:predicted transcriptional regulator
MGSEKQCLYLYLKDEGCEPFKKLKLTDQAVLIYLEELAKDNDTCTASIPKIASACNISQRQVQISAGRLITLGLIKRVGYDFGNPDQSKRGTVYKILRRSK